jgi:hypothetical protein
MMMMMMMKELEESNRFKMVEERKTQGFLESICGEGRRMMIFGDGDETYMSRCVNVHLDVIHMIYQMFQPGLLNWFIDATGRRRSGGLSFLLLRSNSILKALPISSKLQQSKKIITCQFSHCSCQCSCHHILMQIRESGSFRVCFQLAPISG